MADAMPPQVRWFRRVDTRLASNRIVALRRGRMADGEQVWSILGTRDGVTEVMNLSDEAMQALAAAYAVLATETLAPIPLPDHGVETSLPGLL